MFTINLAKGNKFRINSRLFVSVCDPVIADPGDGDPARRKCEKVAKLITMAAAEAEGGTGTPLPSPAKGVAGLPNGGASAGAPWGGSMGPHGAGVPHRVVHRHAVSGDVVLVNRQPTLHKPSILAHNVRVLRGERTVRLHYANCR